MTRNCSKLAFALVQCTILFSLSTFANSQVNTSADDGSVVQIRKKAQNWLNQLGSEQYEERIAAQEQLAKIAPLIRDLLAKATQNEDPEIASRSKAILKQVQAANLKLLDALGNPIPFAKIRISGEAEQDSLLVQPGGRQIRESKFERISLETYSDSQGGFFLQKHDRGKVEVVISQPEFGVGQAELRFPRRSDFLRFPLVSTKSKAAQRALRGIVKDSTGKPIQGAAIQGASVRTPGEGLINPLQPLAMALTDAKGVFRFYLPNRPNSERGKLIPLNSNFRIQVSMPGDTKNIPIGGRYNNTEIAKVVFSLKERLHRLTIESFDGTEPSENDLRSKYFIAYRGIDGKGSPSRVDSVAAAKGLKLKQGVYRCSVFHKGQMVEYQPIKVTKSSREQLVFRLPPSIEYRGRVIHGATRKPLKDIFVIGYSSSAKGRFANLTNADWKALNEVDLSKIHESEIGKKIKGIYGFSSITQTDEKGEFSITQASDQPIYGLIAIAKDFVPYSLSNYHLLPKPENPFVYKTLLKSRAKDFPLFPAARVIVTPIVDQKKLGVERRVSVMPVWNIKAANQPTWFKFFREANTYENGDFKHDKWLVNNQRQIVFVPANLNLFLQLNTPYSEFVSPAKFKMPILLKQGEVKNIGELIFEPTLKVTVQVVDEKGQPVEGLPIRKMDDGTNSWSIVHNTNAKGEALFGVNRNTAGKFRVGEAAFGKKKSITVMHKFKIADSAPDSPVVIKLKPDQIKSIRNFRSNFRQ